MLEEFKSQFYCKGMDGIVRQTLKECSGTCNRLRALKTGKALSNLIRTYAVTERVQIDLIEMYGPTNPIKNKTLCHNSLRISYIKSSNNHYAHGQSQDRSTDHLANIYCTLEQFPWTLSPKPWPGTSAGTD